MAVEAVVQIDNRDYQVQISGASMAHLLLKTSAELPVGLSFIVRVDSHDMFAEEVHREGDRILVRVENHTMLASGRWDSLMEAIGSDEVSYLRY